MKPLRPQTPEGIAREGAAKRTQTEIPTSSGMKRQTVGEMHPFKHGMPLNDEPNSPLPHHAIVAPVHPGMTDAQKAKHLSPANPTGNEVLQSASRLGRPAEDA
jgi:hypothetical protein